MNNPHTGQKFQDYLNETTIAAILDVENGDTEPTTLEELLKEIEEANILEGRRLIEFYSSNYKDDRYR